MRKHLNQIVITILTVLSVGLAQSKYPADSLLASQEISIIKKIGIFPIAAFQRFSYNSDRQNCQFYPSCSNYGAQAISEFGLLRGYFIASDRIIRCNPSSQQNHLKHGGEFRPTDLRLIDRVRQIQLSNSEKSPLLAASFSALIPGSGRIYAGRWFDGLMGVSQFLLYSAITNYAYQKNWKPLAILAGSVSFVIYGGEIYGAYRTAKYY